MIRFLSAMVVALLLGMPGASTAQTLEDATAIGVTLTPEQISVGTFYNGATVQVAADLPWCDDVVVFMAGETEELALNRKGRVAGIWLNVTQVTVANAPEVYVLAASDDLDRICTKDEQRNLHLGEAYLRSQIGFECDRPLTGREFDELIDLKKHRGTYEFDAPVSLSVESSNRVALTAELPVSPTVPPGEYGVRVYGFRDFRLTCKGAAVLSIGRVGLAEWLGDLSQNHAAMYGSVAIAVAILVGIVMGVIFHSLPGSGH